MPKIDYSKWVGRRVRIHWGSGKPDIGTVDTIYTEPNCRGCLYVKIKHGKKVRVPASMCRLIKEKPKRVPREWMVPVNSKGEIVWDPA